MKRIVVTGGAGYIGSHVCKALKQAGYEPIAFDNLSHGHLLAVRYGPFVLGDLACEADLDQLFSNYQPDAVIHLAGSVDLRESIENPAKHYENNVMGSLRLFHAMKKHSIAKLIYSSSAAVYAPCNELLSEEHPKNPLNPYGQTKWITEKLIEEYKFDAIIFRFFNAAGADPAGEIGEAHTPETHLIPRAIFAAQNREPLPLYAHNLPTPDGTAVRDYIHVSDLAQGHIKGLKWLEQNKGVTPFNLGTGHGYSVFEVIAEVEKISGVKIELIKGSQAISEAPSLIADASKAKEQLSWKPEFCDLSSIVNTAWQWHSSHYFLALS